MSTTVSTLSPNRLAANSVADTALKAAAGFWLLMAIIGQWSFLYYIVAFYGCSTLTGNLQAWTKNTFLRMSYVRGDTAGNIAFASHTLLAAVIAFGGALQLVPQIRVRAISVHRWIGRIFFATALGLSTSGLYLVWVRGDRGDLVSGLAISLNGVLIILFCCLAWRSALAHSIATHRRWALRAYLVANAQWFTRVGFMAWVVISQALFHDRAEKSFGPFFSFWNFGCYMVPLAVLELYLRAKEGSSRTGRFAMAGGLVLLTLVMAGGIAAFTLMWQPIVQAAQ